MAEQIQGTREHGPGERQERKPKTEQGDRQGDEQANDAKSEPEPLVPGFGVESEMARVPAFGERVDYASLAPSSNRSSSGSSGSSGDRGREARVRGFAQYMLRRYDRNRSGSLEREEWGEMRTDPSPADRNNDGVITQEELTAQLAARSQGRAEEPGGGGQDSDGSGGSKSNGRKSYRFLTAGERRLEGLPDWFASSDANGDGQRSAGDITQLELCIIDPLTYPPASYPGAAANEDSAVNMIDVGVVEYMILNAWPFDHVYIEAADEVSAGSNFSATLYITRVEHFDSAGYNVTYDPDVLQVTRVTAGSIVPLGSPNWTQIPVDSWGLSGGVQGEVRVTNDVPGAPGINGTGYLSRIHFHVNGSACETSNISFSGGCVLQDMWGSNISATWDGDSLHVSP